MTATHLRGIAAAAIMIAAACGGATGAAAQGGHSHGHSHAPAAAGDTGRWTEADVRFMQKMIGHHAQAIEMARLAPTHGASPAILRLAARIINAQEDEIASMQLWLRDRKQTVPEATAAAHHDHGGEHGAAMPGMLSAAQMKELDEARGPEFDRLFLTYMIQHHRGAVSMVSELFASQGAGQDDAVFKLASDVNVDQITEIDRMQRMLADLLFGAAPQ
jgi:uncharacterized protein (DUF305 family)